MAASYTVRAWAWIGRLRRLAWTSLAVMASMSLAMANETESIRLTQPAIVLTAEQTWAVEADVAVTLNPVLIDAAKRGVPLHFVFDVELLKNRWYWFDEKLAVQSKTVRLGYHAVTQQYRVAVGNGHPMTYPTLEEALAAATQLKNWVLIDAAAHGFQAHVKDLQKNPERYELRLRVRLDTAQLPKPLQINALTNRDWDLSSGWVVPKVVTEVIMPSGAVSPPGPATGMPAAGAGRSP